MAGETAETFGNGLLVSYIGKYIVEQGKLSFGARDGDGGMGHQSEQTGGFHGHGFAAGVRSADEQTAARFIEFKGDRRDGFALLA